MFPPFPTSRRLLGSRAWSCSRTCVGRGCECDSWTAGLWHRGQEAPVDFGSGLFRLEPASAQSLHDHLERGHEGPVADPTLIVPGELDLIAALRVDKTILSGRSWRKAAGKQLAGLFATRANSRDHLVRHAEIEPAFVGHEAHMHNAI